MLTNPPAAVQSDRFGNPFAPGLPYARGAMVTGTADDLRKLQHGWRIIERRIRDHGPGSVFNFSGLERTLPVEPQDLPFLDDDLAPALHGERLRALALQHLGGTADRHDVMLLNRVTAATFATHLALVPAGGAVVGFSASYSHPTVGRAARQAGARFLDTSTLDDFAAALKREAPVSLAVVTRLAVTYDLLEGGTLRRAVDLAHRGGALVYVDDAGGARVGPAAFDQPRMLALGVDVGATGLDKYGTAGPRLGLLAGAIPLVERIRARAFEFGLEARPLLYAAAVRSLEGYRPERVRALVAATKEVAASLRALVACRVHETSVTAQLRGEDILETAAEQAGIGTPDLVPVEATAALAMLLLRDYGILTVHFAAIPPGTSNLLFKFVPPETLARFGGSDAFARAVAGALQALAGMIGDRPALRQLLFGGT